MGNKISTDERRKLRVRRQLRKVANGRPRLSVSALQSTFMRKSLTTLLAAHWQQHRQKIKTSAVQRAQILMRQASLEQKLQNAPRKLALRVSCSTAAVIFIMGVLRLWPMQRAKLVSASKLV